MLTEVLKEIGLSENESKLYLTLLRLGQKPISYLAQRAELNRGLAYVILHDLLKKGLVTKVTKNRTLYFSALDPSSLLQYLEQKKIQIQAQEEKLQTVLAQLVALGNPLAGRPKIRFFDGEGGAKAILNQILHSAESEISGWCSLESLSRSIGREDFKRFIKELAAMKKAPRLIQMNSGAEGYNAQLYSTLKKEMTFEIRKASSADSSPMNAFILDRSTVAFIASPSDNFSLLIESRELAEMQRKLFEQSWNALDQSTVSIGIIHSLTGTMAISERPLVDALLFAIEEINSGGGILGRRIAPVVLDGGSDPERFAYQVEHLLNKYNVCSIFGGWTSASRKTMAPVVEKYHNLLWYSLQHEGLEQSPNIVYTGSVPNQQLLPAIDWASKKIGKRFFLIGSDYVFPRSANEIMKARIDELGAKVAGEAYVKLGSVHFLEVARKIKKSNADVILNTVNGDSNVDLFKTLRSVGIISSELPTISFSIAEEEIGRMQPENLAGDYVVWSYFQSLSTKSNLHFVERFRKMYGTHRTTSDPITSAYCSLMLFAAAVKKAGSLDIPSIREATRGMAFEAPEGKVRIDPDNGHLHRYARIGKIGKDGQISVVWSSDGTIRPDPFPHYRSQADWLAYLDELRERWHGRWES